MRHLAIVLLAVTAPAFAQTLDEGWGAFERGRYDVALPIFTSLAEAGEPAAAFYLGRMYDTGRGVVRDVGEALRWYRVAAARGHRAAQFNLALKYDRGDGVERDPVEAARWYLASATRGYHGAQLNLGTFYVIGDGVERDPLRAYAWWAIASDQGNLLARDNLAELAGKLGPEQVARAEALKAELVETTAAAGNTQ